MIIAIASAFIEDSQRAATCPASASRRSSGIVTTAPHPVGTVMLRAEPADSS